MTRYRQTINSANADIKQFIAAGDFDAESLAAFAARCVNYGIRIANNVPASAEIVDGKLVVGEQT